MATYFYKYVLQIFATFTNFSVCFIYKMYPQNIVSGRTIVSAVIINAVTS